MGDSIPDFEGHPVEGTKIKMSGAMLAEGMDGVVVGVDDIVQVVAQFKCVGVRHDVGGDGNLYRIQLLRPIESNLQPFGDGDDGVLRSPISNVAIGRS